MKTKLRALRQSKGISQTFMAKALGYKYPSGYSNIENGPNGLKLEHAVKIAAILGVSIEELMDDGANFFGQKLHALSKESA